MKLNGTIRHLGCIIGLVSLVYAAGCSSKKIVEEDGGVPTAPSADENLHGDSDAGTALGLQTVHFPYDSFKLDGDAKRALKNNLQILKDKTHLHVQIEGHCDQRGSIQYNIALGEHRAESVKHYLTDMGVSPDRITVISFGKEKLIDSGLTEEAYAKNRRANFVVTSN
jgi:peptidoglycan-associated lipoprotein